MTRGIALHCMKSYSESHSDLCEFCKYVCKYKAEVEPQESEEI